MQTIDRENIGRIHSFESMGAVDGPGLRYIVFMQGCPLKCKYCQNRDTWDFNGGKEYTVEEVLNRILKYKTYMTISNGGVTFQKILIYHLCFVCYLGKNYIQHDL